MGAKGTTNYTQFEEKYNLYGSMLYKLGIVYLGKDERCIEAVGEAFSWLHSRKRASEGPEQEKIELLRHMILICEYKTKRKIKCESDNDELNEAVFTSEAVHLLEAVKGLPNKYRPIVHLALYENLDIPTISKILCIIKPIAMKLLQKGLQLMEMVTEKAITKEYYCCMLDQMQPPIGIKEDLFLCISSYDSVKNIPLLYKRELAFY